MLKNFFYAACVILIMVSCSRAQQSSGGVKQFGTKIDSKNAISYEDLLTKMSSTDSMPAKVTGKISEVCKKKGCWMTLVSDDATKPDMRVTFKDYAFFMPMDIVGKRVVLDGFAIVEVTPVDVLRHYAEDGGKSKEEIAAITEPKRELAFEAAGVIIVD